MKKGDKVIIENHYVTTLVRKRPEIDLKAWEVFPPVIGLRLWREDSIRLVQEKNDNED